MYPGSSVPGLDPPKSLSVQPLRVYCRRGFEPRSTPARSMVWVWVRVWRVWVTATMGFDKGGGGRAKVS